VLISVVVLGFLALLDPLRPVVFVLVLRANRINATAFLVGWAVALSALFIAVFLLAAGDGSGPTSAGQRTWASAAEAVLGSVLLILAARRWQRRGTATHLVTPAAVLRRLNRLDPRRAGFMGVLIQPRTITIAAALVVARDQSGPVSFLIGFALFAVVSTSMLLGIFGYHLWRPQDAERRLSGLVAVLEGYGPLLITALCAVGGGYLLVDGLLGLIRA
jgi:hypothetical protein